MSPFNTYPAVDENYAFPQPVRKAIADSSELKTKVDSIADAKISSFAQVVSTADANVLTTAKEHASSLRWNRGELLEGTDLGALFVNGQHYSRRSTNVVTMLDLPPGSTSNPFKIDVQTISTLNGVYFQEFTQYGVNGPVKFERLSLNNEYGSWLNPNAELSTRTSALEATRLPYGSLPVNTNLSTFTTPGYYSSQTSIVGKTILDRPEDSTADPFLVFVARPSITNKVGYQQFIQWTTSGPKTWERVSLQDVFQPWRLIEKIVRWDRSSVYCYGDSLSEQGFPKFLAAHLNVPVVNRGKSGDTSNDILLRAGIIKLYATPVGGSIPAAAGSVVTLNVFNRELDLRLERSIAVTFAGVAGALTHTGTKGVWTFTRTAAGEIVPVATAKPIFTTHVPPAISTQIFWFGTNDVWNNSSAPDADLETHIVANYARAAESVLVDSERHALLLGMTTNRSTVKGDADYTLVYNVNSRVSNRDPHLFASIQNYLSRQCLKDMKLTPTAADTAATANGLIPPQLYADDLHFTQEAQMAVAQYFIAPQIKGRGWG